MKSQTRTETYGHTIDVTAQEVRRGAWSWNYVVDDDLEGFSQIGAMLPDADSALRRAIAAAQLRADRLRTK